MEYVRIPVSMMATAKREKNVSEENVLLLVRRAVAAKTLNIAILISKSVDPNVKLIAIVTVHTNVRMDTVSNLVQNLANVLLETNIATGKEACL